MECPSAIQADYCNQQQRCSESVTVRGYWASCLLSSPPPHTLHGQTAAMLETGTGDACLHHSAQQDFKPSSSGSEAWTLHFPHDRKPATATSAAASSSAASTSAAAVPSSSDGRALSAAVQEPAAAKRLKVEACDSDNSACTSTSSPHHDVEGTATPRDEAEQKRLAYLEKRRKNNASAKKSRDKRRAKEAEMERRLEVLRIEEMYLQRQLAWYHQRNALLRQLTRAWTAMCSHPGQGGGLRQPENVSSSPSSQGNRG